MFDFFCFFLQKRLFHEETTVALSQKCFKIIISPVRLFFKKHDNNNNNNNNNNSLRRRRPKKKKNGPTGDDGTFRARIQRGFVF